MRAGFEPYITPDSDAAVDEAKEFCHTRGLKPDMVKIVRREGFVRVVVKKNGVKLKI